jgi:hypothetical protein
MIDMKAIGKKYFVTFCKMFENVPFFEHLHSKFAKSANMTQNIFLHKNEYEVSKNA